jgi:hypothetical protein
MPAESRRWGHRVGRLLRPPREHRTDPVAAGGDDDQVVLSREPLDVLGGDRADVQVTAPLLEVGHQRRQVEAVVDDRRGRQEVAAETQRDGRADDRVVVADVAVFAGVPMVDAKGTLALERVVVVRDGVEQAPARDRLGALLGIDRHVNAVLLQEQAEVHARDARTDDADAHCCLLPKRSWP